MRESTGCELWMAKACFGEDAVRGIIEGDRSGYEALTQEEITAIAKHSSVPYWTDGTSLWSIDYQLASARRITAADALATFGLRALEEAREKGTWQP